jgi:regulator of protease activity HflC (stomatin/prohibitin superfamily)
VLANSLRVLREYERGVIFRLGRLQRVKGPGQPLNASAAKIDPKRGHLI